MENCMILLRYQYSIALILNKYECWITKISKFDKLPLNWLIQFLFIQTDI